ncbi:putative uncharacterized protein DDB_G0289009 [Solanum tuberosum]|uniref:putative uncharacterized protein DDB_G0289009 n=1 Tax=Solanum tuberosum TaxID=4113 RepID=UPI00073A1FD1|nr:PREDICTED: putative uncharacterized protein DDB_G0289009 [Solanum tuberosum]
MQSFKIGRVNSINNTNMLENNAYNSFEDDNNNNNNNNLHPVYVGKSRRRYLVTSDVIDHPLFRELIERRTSDSEEYVSVGCEVVLFEHLLWMLQNADPQPESMDELVEFYSYLKIGRVNSINNTNMLENNAYNSFEDDNNNNNNNNLHPVYVGKSRRRYLVTSDVIDHPLFRELIERRTSDSEEYVSVGCEVVLFEHLLWMLQNADPQPESMDELVEFYSC